MARCEDYPCCGHTDGLGCNWTPDYEQIRLHAGCDHEAGFCEVEPEEFDHDLDWDDTNSDGVPWCYGCDDYATDCKDNPEPLNDDGDSGWHDTWEDNLNTSGFIGFSVFVE